MKLFLATLCLAAAAFIFTGCENDMPPNAHTDNALQRGLRGEGTLVPPAAEEEEDAGSPEIPRDSSAPTLAR